MQLPAFVQFTEPVPSIEIKAGDTVWVTLDSATLTRRLDFDRVYLHLHLAKPATLQSFGPDREESS